jgi:hypothetical protein
MALYPKINDMSILLDNDCKRMLKRKSKQLLIIEVLDKLSTIDQKQTLLVDVSNNNDNIDYINYNSDYIVEKKNLYEIILNIFGCNKN